MNKNSLLCKVLTESFKDTKDKMLLEKICQVQVSQDRTSGKQIPCGKPTEFKVKYKEFLHYPAHISYMCAEHAQMATELVKIDRNSD